MTQTKTGRPAPPAVYDNLSIVLVEPQSAGNVGSVARVMMNTGFKRLQLVSPCDYMNNEGFSMACNADALLLKAEVFDNVHECIERAAVVVGTTRRKGRVRWPVMTLPEAVPKLLELSRANKVAVLFGREDRGLTNDEIKLCDMLIEIQSTDEYPSLNLSHAVFAVCYHLFTTALPKVPAIKAAPRPDVEGMFKHLEEALRALNYGEQGNDYLLNTIMRTSKRMFGRTSLMKNEVNMLRGIFTQIIEKTKR
ncbi:MAG: RNA methyltransferase [Deltaproteobacteria bacterium]|nr:RNA methyltransferase [Deltaproteobacteria bacterium]